MGFTLFITFFIEAQLHGYMVINSLMDHGQTCCLLAFRQ